VKGVVNVTGAADWPNAQPPYNFQSYAVEWGPGSDPQQYTVIGSGQTPAANDQQLANWDTSGVPDGQYVIRLRDGNATGNWAEVRVPVVVNNSGSYSGPTFPVSQPKAVATEQKPSAVIVNSNSYTDPTTGQLHVVGTVLNNGNANLSSVQVTANLKDTSGNVIQSPVGYSLLPIMLPGQSSPFDIFTLLPPNLGSAGDLAISFNTTTDVPAAGLAVSGDRMTSDARAQLHLTGVLTNSSREPTTPFRIIYTLLDGSGNPIRAGSVSASVSTNSQAGRLVPGTSGQFDALILAPPAAFATYTLAVQ
jgi:hypothetical protein